MKPDDDDDDDNDDDIQFSSVNYMSRQDNILHLFIDVSIYKLFKDVRWKGPMVLHCCGKKNVALERFSIECRK